MFKKIEGMKDMKIQKRIAKSQAGFTLIEIMVVVIIIGLLSTVVLPNVFGNRDRAFITKASLYTPRHQKVCRPWLPIQVNRTGLDMQRELKKTPGVKSISTSNQARVTQAAMICGALVQTALPAARVQRKI